MVRRMRAAGVPVFFTIDAGPQVKAVCLPEAIEEVEMSWRRCPRASNGCCRAVSVRAREWSRNEAVVPRLRLPASW